MWRFGVPVSLRLKSYLYDYNRTSIIQRISFNPKIKTMLCFLLGNTGVCYENADCKYGYHCDHPICDTTHHHCLCGGKIYTTLPIH